MAGLAKGKVLIRREEFLNSFGIPVDAELVELNITDNGDIEVVLISDKPLELDGKPITHDAEYYRDNHNNIRRVVAENTYKPRGKEYW